jgi:hypothetical protein
MINEEIVSAVARFFDAGRGPSHDELTRQFRRAGLDGADPQRLGDSIGKMKRVREVLFFALDSNPDAGDTLVRALLGCLKASGGFRPGSDSYAGDDVIRAGREAFRSAGFDLDPEGNLRPTVLEGLDGAEMTDALRSYVRRARSGSRDAALVVGTGKDLLEATARHVLVEKTGSYPQSSHFPTTLYQAFERLNLCVPAPELQQKLSSDPLCALQQCLWLLGCAVNRLRNAEGTGHGRPSPATVTDPEAELAVQAMGLVSQLLLGRLRP